jgi:hypothetical protein
MSFSYQLTQAAENDIYEAFLKPSLLILNVTPSSAKIDADSY